MATGLDTKEVSAEARFGTLLWTLLLLLWCLQVWKPQLSYPREGVIEVIVLLLIAGGAAWNAWRSETRTGLCVGAVAALALLGYATGRFAFQKFAAVGAENFGTLVVAIAYGLTAFLLARNIDRAAAVRIFSLFIMSGAIACAIHPIAQYAWLYDRAREVIEKEVAASGVEPSPMQVGLLHHFSIKRVASVWGDPNSLGAFLALSLPVSLGSFWRIRDVISGPRRVWMKAFAVTAFIAATAGIALTGSRGAILDAIIGIAIIMLLLRRPKSGKYVAVAAVAILLMLPVPSQSQSQQPLVGMLSRSSTITERINYAVVGLRIIERSPIFGSGFGAVDRLYGRYKPEMAREAKYLHNWPLQISAELGLLGLTLTLLLMARTFASGKNTPLILIPWIVLLMDGLWQHSFNQRELLCLFGIMSGVLLAGNPKPSQRQRPAVPIIAFALVAVVLITLVVPRLLGLANKQNAEDLLDVNEFSEARRALAGAERYIPNDPEVYLLRASIEETAGRLGAARMLLQQAERLQPDSASVQAQLSRFFLLRAETAKAEQHIRRALELYPSNAQYCFDYANVLERKGDLAGAVQWAEKAVRLGYLYKEKYEKYLAGLKSRAGSSTR